MANKRWRTCSLAQIAAVITRQFYLLGSIYKLRPKLADIPNLPPYTWKQEHSCSNFQFEIVWVNYFCCNCPLSQCCLRYSGYVWNVLISDPRLIMQGSVALTNPCTKGYATNEHIHCYCSRLKLFTNIMQFIIDDTVLIYCTLLQSNLTGLNTDQ